MSGEQYGGEPAIQPPRDVVEKARAEAANLKAYTLGDEKPVVPHPRERIMQMISRKCEEHIDQIAMLRAMRAQVQFMERHEADLLLQAIRSAERTGLLRW